MNAPILKIHWERFKAHVDLDISTTSRLLEPFTTDDVGELLLSEGCANTNYKWYLKIIARQLLFASTCEIKQPCHEK